MANQKQKTKPSEKPKAFHELYTDRQYVSPELAEYIRSKGLEFRWINLNKYRSEGFHRTGWAPFKRDEKTPMSDAETLMGTRPDGFIVRGDLVLAVKTIESAEAYREHLQAKNKILSRQVKKEAVSKLKSAFSEAGIKAQIHEGYEENE